MENKNIFKVVAILIIVVAVSGCLDGDSASTINSEGKVKGSSDAPVTIIEYSDFECPYCARFYGNTLEQIEEKYIKTGKAKLAFRHFPLNFHAEAQKAAEAAECAREQGKFWEMHNMLFEKGVDGGIDSFKKYAENLGLNSEEFNGCIDSGRTADIVKADLNKGKNKGVTGTPTFFISGNKISGAQPFKVFQQAIEAEL